MDSARARQMILDGSAPDNLSVGGWLSLSGCTRLTSLSDNLSVCGSLDLSGCTGLTSLPDGSDVVHVIAGRYPLICHPDGTYSAGCQKRLTVAQARSLAAEWHDPDKARAYLEEIERREARRVGIDPEAHDDH